MRSGMSLPVTIMIVGTLLIIFALLVVGLSPMIGSNITELEEETEKCLTAGGYCVERVKCLENGRIMRYASCEDQKTSSTTTQSAKIQSRDQTLVCCSQPAQ